MSASVPNNPDPTRGPAASAAPTPGSVPSGKNPPPPKAHPAPPLNALAILKALRRRWLPAALLGVVLAGAAFAAVWFFLPPPQYCATAKFLIPSKPEGTLFDHPEAKTDFATFEDTQMAILKSHMVLAAALRKPQVAALDPVKAEVARGRDPVDWLEKEVHIDFPNGKEILRLSIYSDDDKTCKTLLAAVKDAYLDEVDNDIKRRRQERLDQLRELSTKFEGELKTLRDALHAAAKPVGGGNDVAIALKQIEAHEQLTAARRDLVEVQERLTKLETDEKLAKDRGPATAEISDQMLDSVIDKRPDMADLLTQKARLEAQIELMKPMAVGGENNPEVHKQIVALEALKQNLNSARAGLRAEAKKQLQDQAATTTAGRANQLQQEIENAKALRDKLQRDIVQLSKDAQEFNDAEIGVEDLKRQITEKEGVAKLCADDFQKLSIERLDPYRVTPWEGGEIIVSRPDEMTRKAGMADMGAGGAFVAAALLIGLLEFKARRINAPHDLARSVGMSVVGTLPARPSMRRVSRDPAWQALLTESVDSARTMLLHGAGPEAPRVVMVTSAVGGEAKTSLAGHLAVSLARSGRKTLLIDGDLRSPAAHRLFGVRPDPGLSELLRGESLIPDVLCPSGVNGLEVLTAGTCDPETLAQLAQGIFGVVLARLRESFDFIVVDSSPVLPVTDSLLIARHVDGVLFSVLQNVSTVPAVQEAYQRLTSLNVLLLGAVVSGVRADVSSYGRRRYLTLAAAGQ